MNFVTPMTKEQAQAYQDELRAELAHLLLIETPIRYESERIYQIRRYFKELGKECESARKTKIVAQFGPEYTFVSDSQDTAPIKADIAGAKDYDAFFVLLGDGEYTEVWGMAGIVPFRSKLVTRLL
jgi:hypothetical protein